MQLLISAEVAYAETQDRSLQLLISAEVAYTETQGPAAVCKTPSSNNRSGGRQQCEQLQQGTAAMAAAARDACSSDGPVGLNHYSSKGGRLRPG